MASVDLQEAYLLASIYQDDRKFLCFRFQSQLFQFRALAFQSRLSSIYFHKEQIEKNFLSTLREKDFLSVVYLDEFFLIAPSFQKYAENISTTTNVHKCVLTPTMSCRFLSFIFDTELKIVSIPLERRHKLLQSTLSVLNKKSCMIRWFVSYIGSLITICPAIQYGIMCTKIMKKEKFLALSVAEDNFEAEMVLPASIHLFW